MIEPEIPGMVPEYECREAAVYVGVTWRDWQLGMSGDERAAAVAHYRMHILIQAHLDHAAEQRSSQLSAQAQANGRSN